MASNLLSNIGLVSQGMRAAEMDTAALEQQKQATRRGAMGLADLERGVQEQESMRSAIRGSQSINESLIAQAEELRKSGNPKWQDIAREAFQMPQRNADEMAQAVLGGATVEQVDAINKRNMGSGQYDDGSLRIDKDPKTGDLIVSATRGGQPLPPINVTQEYAKKQKPVTLSAGQVMINPATGKPVASNIQPEAGASDGFTYIKSGPEAGKIKERGGPRTTVSISKTEGGAQAQKDLPMFNAISKQIAGHPDMGTLDQFGNPTLTPAGNIKAAIGNQIAQTNRNLDPATVVNIVMNGKPKVNPKTGEKAIEYKGKYYRYSEGSAQPQGTLTTKETTSRFARGGKVNHKGIC